MADEIDQTDAVEDKLKDLQIQNIRNRGRELEPMGACHWCDEMFPNGSLKLFCDEACGHDHARYNSR